MRLIEVRANEKVKGRKEWGVILDGVSSKSLWRRGKLSKDPEEMRETTPQKCKRRVTGAKALRQEVSW